MNKNTFYDTTRNKNTLFGTTRHNLYNKIKTNNKHNYVMNKANRKKKIKKEKKTEYCYWFIIIL